MNGLITRQRQGGDTSIRSAQQGAVYTKNRICASRLTSDRWQAASTGWSVRRTPRGGRFPPSARGNVPSTWITHAKLGVTTSAIEHLHRGMNVVELQKMLGHKDLETTHKYLTALDDKDVKVQALRTSPVEQWTGGGPGLTGTTSEADAVTWRADHSATVTFSPDFNKEVSDE